MNSIDIRLTKILSGVRSSNASNTAIQQVVDAINSLNFGGVSSEGLATYFHYLPMEDRITFLQFGGCQAMENSLSNEDLYRTQQAAFSLEFIRQRDLEPKEVNGQTLSAFNIGMIEIFGQDWESQLQKPRGSSSIACGYSKEQRQVKKTIINPDTGETVEKLVNKKVKTEQTWLQMGAPILSLKPFENGKHPTGTIQREVNGKWVELEVPIHQPTENGLECGVILTNKHWALATKTAQSKLTGDITSGGVRQVFVVGLVEHWKMRKCCEVGYVPIGNQIVDLGAYNAELAKRIWFADEEGNDTLLQEALMADPLVQYYRENFDGINPVKLAHNARAGVSRDRLTKNGLAPKIWMGKVPGDVYQDAAQRAAQTRRYLDYQVDDVIRRLIGKKKLTSAQRLLSGDARHDNYMEAAADLRKNNPNMKFAESVQKIIEKSADHYMDEQELDVSDWYDEVYHAESGRTFYQQAILELHNRWKNQNRSYMKEIGTVTKDGNELHVIPKNIGKVGRSKDTKRRTGDKSTTVNGARCRTLTTAFMHVEITLDREIPGWESLGFRQMGDQWKLCSTVENRQIVGEVMEMTRFAELMGCCELDAMGLALEEMESGDFKFGGTSLTKDDVTRLYNNMLMKMSNASSEFMISEGNAWICFRDHLTPEWCLVEMRHIEVDELKALQAARERVMACGEELNERNILSALQNPKKWTQKSAGKIGSTVSAERLAEVKAMIRAAAA